MIETISVFIANYVQSVNMNIEKVSNFLSDVIRKIQIMNSSSVL